ncbi:MAG: hypothetical protein Q7J27_14025, partial [Syntrophales bacterium]|nr:hypothetical protein [Syntrophales bacterium]
IKSILLGSLLHDIGHYPLAHDLSEFDPDLAHEKFNSKFLESPTRDKLGRTLKETIEDENYGWGVKIENIIKLLKVEVVQSDLFHKEDLKYKIISSIIDGPIDVDKLDYLLRDSQNCYLRYGEFVDFDRLIRNLTVIIFSSSYDMRSLSLGIYEKGQSAAESLTFARYLLYQSLYWHHTSRSIKVMLREVMKTIDKKKFKNKNFNTEFDKLIGANGELKNKINEYSVLEFLSKWTMEEGNRLISMILNRNYYKRILTIHADYKKEEVGKETVLGKFRRHYNDHNFQGSLQKLILLRYNNFIVSTGYPRETSILSEEHTNRVAQLLKNPNMILCDCPDPRYGTEKKLRVIAEPQRLRKNYSERFNNVERISEVWNEIHFNLMNIAAKGRIFCHPEIREDIMIALGPNGIQECVEQAMNSFEVSGRSS